VVMNFKLGVGQQEIRYKGKLAELAHSSLIRGSAAAMDRLSSLLLLLCVGVYSTRNLADGRVSM